MLDNSNSSEAGSFHEPGAPLPVCLFLDEHGAALEAAAGLLGGDRWARRVLKLRQDVRAGALPRRACVVEFQALGRLLRLEKVAGPDAEESAYFAAIDPADPRVHDICMLSDRLDQLIAEFSERFLPGAVPGGAPT